LLGDDIRFFVGDVIFSLVAASFLDNKTYIDDMILIDGESLFLLVCGGGFIGDVIANR